MRKKHLMHTRGDGQEDAWTDSGANGIVRVFTLIAIVAIAGGRPYAASDIVLYSSDFGTLRGNFSSVTTSGAAGGQAISSPDVGWSTPNNALATPPNYVEATFSAPSSTAYHVWIRLRAGSDSKFNDSIWAQFSDALDSSARSVYPIGSTSGLLLNLENCSGCALSGWGWQDKAYWLQQTNVVQFASSGTHTIRIQTREDGVQVDQVVLSPATYLTSSPGAVSNDSTIVPKSQSGTATSPRCRLTRNAGADSGVSQGRNVRQRRRRAYRHIVRATAEAGPRDRR